jgi:hypothetical protein
MEVTTARTEGIWAGYCALVAGLVEAIGLRMYASYWDCLLPTVLYLGSIYGLRTLSRPVSVGIATMQIVTGLIRWRAMDQDFNENAYALFMASFFASAAWGAIRHGQPASCSMR